MDLNVDDGFLHITWVDWEYNLLQHSSAHMFLITTIPHDIVSVLALYMGKHTKTMKMCQDFRDLMFNANLTWSFILCEIKLDVIVLT